VPRAPGTRCLSISCLGFLPARLTPYFVGRTQETALGFEPVAPNGYISALRCAFAAVFPEFVMWCSGFANGPIGLELSACALDSLLRRACAGVGSKLSGLGTKCVTFRPRLRILCSLARLRLVGFRELVRSDYLAWPSLVAFSQLVWLLLVLALPG